MGIYAYVCVCVCVGGGIRFYFLHGCPFFSSYSGDVMSLNTGIFKFFIFSLILVFLSYFYFHLFNYLIFSSKIRVSGYVKMGIQAGGTYDMIHDTKFQIYTILYFIGM